MRNWESYNGFSGQWLNKSQGYAQYVDNYYIPVNPNMLIFKKMKSLEELNKEAAEINLNIRKLMLNKHCFDAGLEEKIGVVVKITALRDQLALVQREIRIRSADYGSGSPAL
jgi:hypothetical protein